MELPRSQYKVGSKRLDELNHVELLEATETLWQQKNEEISKMKGERDGYKKIVESNFVTHALWARIVENGMLLWFASLVAYLLGKALA